MSNRKKITPAACDLDASTVPSSDLECAAVSVSDQPSDDTADLGGDIPHFPHGGVDPAAQMFDAFSGCDCPRVLTGYELTTVQGNVARLLRHMSDTADILADSAVDTNYTMATLLDLWIEQLESLDRALRVGGKGGAA